jgi:hypothetical protein
MHESHPVFNPPSDPDIKIWRYISLAKLIDLLERRALFFPRSDRLGDPFEGSFPTANRIVRAQVGEQLKAGLKMTEADANGLSKALAENRGWFAEEFRKHVAISCWHMNEFESAAMWSLYGPLGESVAIQSTYRRFSNAFRRHNEPVYIGTVSYLDYDRQPIDEGNIYTPYLYKRLSYQHDRELRAIVIKSPDPAKYEAMIPKEFWAQETMSTGSHVDVDLDAMIEHIYIAPTAADWFGDVVRAIAGKYGIPSNCCTHSLLNATPFF